MPAFYLGLDTPLSFFCLLSDHKTYMLQASCPQERPKSGVGPEDAARGLVWVTSSGTLSGVTQSSTSKSTVRNGCRGATFPTLLFLPYAEVREQQQTEVPHPAVFAYSCLLNSIFHSFLLVSSY